MMSGFDGLAKSDKSDRPNSRGDKSSLVFHEPAPEPTQVAPPPVSRVRRPFVKPVEEFEKYKHEVVEQTFEVKNQPSKIYQRNFCSQLISSSGDRLETQSRLHAN